jgi:hypothetical protein
VTVAYRKQSNKLGFFVPVATLFLLPGKVLIACPLRSQSSARIARSYYRGISGSPLAFAQMRALRDMGHLGC